jgi:segregation and condensation protein A
MESILGRQTGGYTVNTPAYEGPLDLLLGLIERAELDIALVSLAAVTDQYLVYIRGLEQARADEISAFLVIAAKLLQIKSEALLPRPLTHAPGEEDVARDLLQQLQIYKRFKEKGTWLRSQEERNLRTYLRVAPPPKVEPKLDLSTLTMEKLLGAAETIFARGAEKESLGTVIAAPRITIREKLEMIAGMLKDKDHARFGDMLAGKPSRLEVVVTFLALLELVKRYRVQAKQVGLFSEIEINRLEEWLEGEEIEPEFD